MLSMSEARESPEKKRRHNHESPERSKQQEEIVCGHVRIPRWVCEKVGPSRGARGPHRNKRCCHRDRQPGKKSSRRRCAHRSVTWHGQAYCRSERHSHAGWHVWLHSIWANCYTFVA